ncbi:divergent PAP2 family protein [Lachnospiraceae bacterium YH-ros2228]
MTPTSLIEKIISNPVLMTVAIAWLLAQGSKMVIEIVKGDFKIQRLTGAGGMPSSHTATVTSLAVSCGIVEGFNSTEFAIALILAIVVIADALSVRAEAGKHAKILNRLRERELDEMKALPHQIPDDKSAKKEETKVLSHQIPDDKSAKKHVLSNQDSENDPVYEENFTSHSTPLFDKPLKEELGHTLPQVIVGGLIGIATACLVTPLL